MKTDEPEVVTRLRDDLEAMVAVVALSERFSHEHAADLFARVAPFFVGESNAYALVVCAEVMLQAMDLERSSLVQ